MHTSLEFTTKLLLSDKALFEFDKATLVIAVADDFPKEIRLHTNAA